MQKMKGYYCKTFLVTFLSFHINLERTEVERNLLQDFIHACFFIRKLYCLNLFMHLFLFVRKLYCDHLFMDFFPFTRNGFFYQRVPFFAKFTQNKIKISLVVNGKWLVILLNYDTRCLGYYLQTSVVFGHKNDTLFCHLNHLFPFVLLSISIA